ncbi:secreted RxLR effector protein 161-like [Gossypium hirsutum]|uniref:Secreted RxLR effector protein 161-like n=1 Tax=Gossypium hirsutum TaxID=3635 RepID=A0ABM3AD21_GOSHI|nr:secreted RxLR effector protein 161-like [Gossypium hirsutum]
MQNCKAVSTLVAVGESCQAKVISKRFMHCCNASHFQVAKRILMYIKGTLSFGIMFTKIDSMKLFGYVNSDWVGLIDDMKSTSGYLFTFGSTIFCWSSKKQSVVAQSTAEAEYVEAGGAINQDI